MTNSPARHLAQITVRVAAAIGLCIALSGCIVVPVGGHGFYHPYRYY